ncbi:E3 ubiquitin-protein ligase CCNB1IP1 [Sphaceloma murrayae]|uniref:E3 ubiquitin-protein ligase CCNB1IP1 n=1 Tax=Sphaceloma murrayae TaxID=2082308 RepID=A0A2K1QTX6_9PEZI|nr:E3 ubiquitin-protein ligase CCNB1IP1 [Sphaceloma murrayae]
MECATRAMSFFSYQAVQEIHYQNATVRQVADRFEQLQKEARATLEDAKGRLEALNNRLTAADEERDDLIRKNEELAEAYRKKAKAHAHLQQLYNKLKGQQDITLVEQAAADHVDQMTRGANPGEMPPPPERPAQAHMAAIRSPSILYNQRHLGGSSAGVGAHQYQPGARIAGRGSDGNLTPAAQRHRLGVSPRNNNASLYSRTGPNLGTSVLHPAPARAPLRNLDPTMNGMPGSSQGMSAGAK